MSKSFDTSDCSVIVRYKGNPDMELHNVLLVGKTPDGDADLSVSMLSGLELSDTIKMLGFAVALVSKISQSICKNTNMPAESLSHLLQLSATMAQMRLDEEGCEVDEFEARYRDRPDNPMSDFSPEDRRRLEEFFRSMGGF